MDDVDPLSSLLGYAVKRASAALRARMDDALRPLDLSVPQYACLRQLRESAGMTNAELARGAFVTPQAMHQVVTVLARRGAVETAGVAAGRRRPVRLTRSGAELVDEGARVVAAVEATMTHGLDDAEERRLVDALTRCADALDGEDRAPEGDHLRAPASAQR